MRILKTTIHSDQRPFWYEKIYHSMKFAQVSFKKFWSRLFKVILTEVNQNWARACNLSLNILRFFETDFFSRLFQHDQIQSQTCQMWLHSCPKMNFESIFSRQNWSRFSSRRYFPFLESEVLEGTKGDTNRGLVRYLITITITKSHTTRSCFKKIVWEIKKCIVRLHEGCRILENYGESIQGNFV